MAEQSGPRTNDLIDALSVEEWERLGPGTERVELSLGQVLNEPGREIVYAYFPTTAIVSLLYVTQDGSSAEIAMVGHEGVVGVTLLLGGGTTLNRAVVQGAGEAFRVRAQLIKDEFERNGPLAHLMLRYTQALITQMAQTAVCNRHHTVDQQLCRWLLLGLDRSQGPELLMTQELISNMLGVRREGVTAAALKLQRSGLIAYSRGHITVLDRDALQSRTCECYAVVKREYDRLLPRRLARGGAIRARPHAGEPTDAPERQP
jgi:CRP-like cAMP-binding protein